MKHSLEALVAYAEMKTVRCYAPSGDILSDAYTL